MSWVTEQLQSGRLQIGDALPGERRLAETLCVSRSSLREALRVLEALGAIRTSTGSGPNAGTVISAEPEQALTLALTLQLATSHVDYSHLREVRLLLETWAAEHASTDDVTTAEHLLERMDDPNLTVAEFLALDADFHVAISRTAQNPLISTLMDALRLSISEHTLARAEALPDWSRTAARLRAEHRAILDAVRSGHRRAASALLRQHIEAYSAETDRARSAPAPSADPA